VPTLLLVLHTPTANTRALGDALVEGAHDDALEGVEVRVLAPDATTAEDLLAADGLVLLGPANFGYMSGLLKDLFDRTFLAVGGSLGDDGGGRPAAGPGRLPWALVVHGRYDTEGAVRSVESIAQALPWRKVADPLQVLGDVGETDRAAAYERAATVAALVSDA
jgi:NAD(P)H-dependent FMN reductase